MKLHINPQPGELRGGVGAVVEAHVKHLTKRGVQFVKTAKEADLVVGHALAPPGMDVFHSHGFYPTAQDGWGPMYVEANQRMFQSMMTARAVVSVSELAAEVMRRDFHLSPTVIRNGVDLGLIRPGGDKNGYILWPKMEVNPTCDPAPFLDLATKHSDLPLASMVKLEQGKSFKRLPHSKFLGLLAQCAVYLGTTRENCSMGTMESMAMGLPVVGYNWGFSRGLDNGVGCLLVEPGADLYPALQEVKAHWKQYHEDAMEYARLFFGWDAPITDLYNLYLNLLTPPAPVTVSVVIPLHNYARWVNDAIQSVTRQTRPADEIIVVDDASTDNPKIPAGVKYIRLDNNQGVAYARNLGISQATGSIILCLDADDKLHSEYIQNALPAFKDPRVGISFGSLLLINEGGGVSNKRWFLEGFSYPEQTLGNNRIPTCCMFRKEAWARAGGYRYYEQPCEDAGLWLRITSQGWKVHQMQTSAPAAFYRMHSGSLTHSVSKKPDWFRESRAWKSRNSGVLNRPVQIYDCPQVSFLLYYKDEKDFIRTVDSIEGLSATSWEICVYGVASERIINGWPFVWWNKIPDNKIIYRPAPGEVITEAVWNGIIQRKDFPA